MASSTNAEIEKYLQVCTFDSRLKEGIRYALTGGKHLRSQMTLDILHKLLPNAQAVELQALILVPEFIHTASLIIDDLPSFDNSNIRRGKSAVHIQFGEGMAYLLSFTLVTEALLLLQKYDCILEKIHSDWSHRKKLLTAHLLKNVGAERAIGGQLMSTFHTSGVVNITALAVPERMSHDEIVRVLSCKTTPFFEIALLVGWICGGGSLESLDTLHTLAESIGIAYQLHDDLEDYLQDTTSTHFSHNYVYHCGNDACLATLASQVSLIRALALQLDIYDCDAFGSFLTTVASNTREEA